jgi:hypothetical protein
MDQLAATITVKFEEYQIALQKITKNTSYQEENNSKATETSSEIKFRYITQDLEIRAYGFQHAST